MRPTVETIQTREIPHTRVESSHVHSVGYDAEQLILEVAFKSGGTYRYLGVRPEHYQALMDAPSLGKHLHAHVRGKYETVKMAEVVAPDSWFVNASPE